MSTPQSIPLTARIQIGLGTAMTAFGILVAIAVSITILALTGANHTTVTTPVTASQAAAGSTPQIHYLGPRQEQAAINPQSGGDNASTAGVGNPPAGYACLGAARSCLR